VPLISSMHLFFSNFSTLKKFSYSTVSVLLRLFTGFLSGIQTQINSLPLLLFTKFEQEEISKRFGINIPFGQVTLATRLREKCSNISSRDRYFNTTIGYNYILSNQFNFLSVAYPSFLYMCFSLCIYAIIDWMK